MNCSSYPLTNPRVVAIATDTYLTARHPFPDPINLPGVPAPSYGQDITTGRGRPAPGGYSVGKTAADLEPKMRRLLVSFASGDKSGMAKRLFDAFLLKQSAATYFDDAALDAAAARHANITHFCNAAWGGPGMPATPGRNRIHQALRIAGWDISRVISPADLGVPAFNDGNKALSTGDFDNGLGLMINGVQYAYAVATHYHYDAAAKRYCIGLRFMFYDVFGLDDDDLKEYGEKSDGLFATAAGVGITAWWQLQHQFGYAPLVTRIRVDKWYEAEAR